ncbi:hypothetical protein BC835DRAFT_1311390 [Cytidiella melzeri]|nr:hypothetical protein BC835DRAFT_1311390 [Cytidiella melzeri]
MFPQLTKYTHPSLLPTATDGLLGQSRAKKKATSRLSLHLSTLIDTDIRQPSADGGFLPLSLILSQQFNDVAQRAFRRGFRAPCKAHFAWTDPAHSYPALHAAASCCEHYDNQLLTTYCINCNRVNACTTNTCFLASSRTVPRATTCAIAARLQAICPILLRSVEQVGIFYETFISLPEAFLLGIDPGSPVLRDLTVFDIANCDPRLPSIYVYTGDTPHPRHCVQAVGGHTFVYLTDSSEEGKTAAKEAAHSQTVPGGVISDIPGQFEVLSGDAVFAHLIDKAGNPAHDCLQIMFGLTFSREYTDSMCLLCTNFDCQEHFSRMLVDVEQAKDIMLGSRDRRQPRNLESPPALLKTRDNEHDWYQLNVNCYFAPTTALNVAAWELQGPSDLLHACREYGEQVDWAIVTTIIWQANRINVRVLSTLRKMGHFGDPHKDENDFTAGLSCGACLSDLSDKPGCEPGCLHFLGVGCWGCSQYMAQILFSGLLHHGGTSPLVPGGQPMEKWETHMLLISYPATKILTDAWVGIELLSLVNFMARSALQHLHFAFCQLPSSYGAQIDAGQFLKAFSLDVDGHRPFSKHHKKVHDELLQKQFNQYLAGIPLVSHNKYHGWDITAINHDDVDKDYNNKSESKSEDNRKFPSPASSINVNTSIQGLPPGSPALPSGIDYLCINNDHSVVLLPDLRQAHNNPVGYQGNHTLPVPCSVPPRSKPFSPVSDDNSEYEDSNVGCSGSPVVFPPEVGVPVRRSSRIVVSSLAAKPTVEPRAANRMVVELCPFQNRDRQHCTSLTSPISDMTSTALSTVTPNSRQPCTQAVRVVPGPPLLSPSSLSDMTPLPQLPSILFPPPQQFRSHSLLTTTESRQSGCRVFLTKLVNGVLSSAQSQVNSIKATSGELLHNALNVLDNIDSKTNSLCVLHDPSHTKMPQYSASIFDICDYCNGTTVWISRLVDSV